MAYRINLISDWNTLDAATMAFDSRIFLYLSIFTLTFAQQYRDIHCRGGRDANFSTDKILHQNAIQPRFMIQLLQLEAFL